MGFLISADEEEQIRQSEEYKQYTEEHKEGCIMAEQEVKEDEQVKEPTPKTEEQIRAELQAEYEKIADKRVTDALKKQEKKWADKLNADRQEREQEDTTRQGEQAKADEARERDIITKSLKLAVVDTLQELRLDPSMHNLIMVEDLVNLSEGQRAKKLADRVMCLCNMFKAEVNKQIQAEKTNYLRGTTPRTSNTKPISKYDEYKSTGNVQGMISEKLREYRDEDDY